MVAALVGVQVLIINMSLDESLDTGLKTSLIETRFSRRKERESMELVESSTSRGSFLILGLDVWRNVSFDEM
tara:strand:- start:92 stop:307 length:216 start_codon:yes stop_codon:yes gene_type:complete